MKPQARRRRFSVSDKLVTTTSAARPHRTSSRIRRRNVSRLDRGCAQPTRTEILPPDDTDSRSIHDVNDLIKAGDGGLRRSVGVVGQAP